MVPKSFLTPLRALSLYLPHCLQAQQMRIVMDSGLVFHRAFLHPAPRDIAAGFLRYPNHILQGNRHDLPADARARPKIDIDIAPGQKIIGR
jgi:hypothetical protein